MRGCPGTGKGREEARRRGGAHCVPGEFFLPFDQAGQEGVYGFLQGRPIGKILMPLPKDPVADFLGHQRLDVKECRRSPGSRRSCPVRFSSLAEIRRKEWARNGYDPTGSVFPFRFSPVIAENADGIGDAPAP
jgi:hypothetical protein